MKLLIIFLFFILLYLCIGYLNNRDKETFLDYTNPDLIKMVLNQNDYTAEKKKVSYTCMTKPQNSVRYFLDEHRKDFIEDIPFSPHIILDSYDDVDVSSKIKITKEDKDIEDIDKIDEYIKTTYENDFCSKTENKHLKKCLEAERQYKCFGKIEFTQKECEARNDLIGNRVEPGVWDRRCVADGDCPFYKANINYPNEFGKCNNNGYCELPKGLKPVGYRKYMKNSLPLCYNCENKKNGTKNVDTCCSEQHNPDYVFNNDLKVRYKFRKELEKKGLSTITNDNYQQEFRELEKKLKI